MLCVTRALAQMTEHMLYALKRKILIIIIYGTMQQNGHWLPRRNSEVYSLYTDLYTVDYTEIRWLGWEGHIIRTEEERILKMILNGKFHHTRSVGKPIIRWKDVDQRDALQILGIRSWGRYGGREEWRHLLKEARDQKRHSAIHGQDGRLVGWIEMWAFC
jgi:hypothetical protein